MEIVDAHVHYWSPESHQWIATAARKGHPAGTFQAAIQDMLFSGPRGESIVTYLLEQYHGDVQGYNVTQAVHVQACWLGDPVGETIWLDKIADGDKDGFPQAIVGFCDLSSSDADSVLQRHCRSKRFRGIRQQLNYDPDKPLFSEATQEYLDNPQWVEGVGLLEKYGLSFELQILTRQMERAAAVARQFPRVMFMVDHCGMPYERDPATMQLWRNGLQGLAKCPNVYCKVSGMFATDPQWDQDSIATVVQPCLDLFGMDRCVFASDFPVDRINGTFSQLITALEVILKPYTEEERYCFFAGNAKKFYRL